VAGASAKLGHAWWGIVVVAGFCLAGSVIEHLTSARTTQVPSRA
jgi:hypothetical protein